MKRICSLLLVAGLLVNSCSLPPRRIGDFDAFPPYPGSEDLYIPTPMPGVFESGFVKTSLMPESSFSVDADGASYAIMRRSINEIGSACPPNLVRIEEYLNYFTFDYPEPAEGETLGINAEIGPCPWAPEHRLLRLGLKGKSLPENEIPAANFILLVDVSGSMSGSDRIDLVKTGLCSMVDCLRPDDRIAIITYSGKVKMLLESTLVSEGRSAIKAAIRSLQASGTTNGGEAMKMAYEEASAHYIEGGNNRIIMCTDGDFNVGVSSTSALVEMVQYYLKKGIYLSIMGFGVGNYQDGRMEAISNKGNGTYTYIDSEREMIKVFVNERSHFWTVANDTKCQVRFNPETVESYRLIGYTNRIISGEEFKDEKKDAGEIGAGQTVTALYEVILNDIQVPEGGPAPTVATFETRYKQAIKNATSRSLQQDILWDADGNPSENFYFAAGVATFAQLLAGSRFRGDATVEMAHELVNGARTYDPDGFRAELVQLMDKLLE